MVNKWLKSWLDSYLNTKDTKDVGTQTDLTAEQIDELVRYVKELEAKIAELEQNR